MAAAGSRRSTLPATAFASLGPGQFRAGRQPDAIDGLVPQAVIVARETEQVRTAVMEARRLSLSLIATGGGCRVEEGNVATAFDLRLVTTALGDLVDYSPEDMVVTVQAGMTLARLNRHLEASGQRLSIDVADPTRASIGGIVAAADTGGLRYGFGEVRDLVLAMDVVDGSGRSYTSGSRVVKNVAGYDLPRLFTGSRGSLGVITQVSMRTHPVAQASTTVLIEAADAGDADKLRAKLFDAALPLAALDLAFELQGTAPASWTIILRLEGSTFEIDAMHEAIEQLAESRSLGTDDDWFSPCHTDLEAVVALRVQAAPASILPALSEAFEFARTREIDLVGGVHLGSGLARLNISELNLHDTDNVASFIKDLRRLGDDQRFGRFSVVLERAPVALKQLEDVYGPAPASLTLMREIKKRFDPSQVLSPGRMAGRL